MGVDMLGFFAEIGSEVVGVNVLADLNRSGGVSDRHTIFDDVLARGNGTNRVFVSVGADLDIIKRIDYHSVSLSLRNLA